MVVVHTDQRFYEAVGTRWLLTILVKTFLDQMSQQKRGEEKKSKEPKKDFLKDFSLKPQSEARWTHMDALLSLLRASLLMT
jgi:DNA-directed RNA polymerase specialized sigma24 family protein